MTLSPDMYFSYSQFFIYDKELESPACAWTEQHSNQGFARREQSIAVGTLLEFGSAKIRIFFETPENLVDFDRVIAIPLVIKSGSLAVDGPEEYPIDRSYPVPIGNYRVVIAQRVLNDDHEEIDLFLESAAPLMQSSEILIADSELNPSYPLLETAEVAGI